MTGLIIRMWEEYRRIRRRFVQPHCISAGIVLKARLRTLARLFYLKVLCHVSTSSSYVEIQHVSGGQGRQIFDDGQVSAPRQDLDPMEFPPV